jgi:hypothetical protein
VPTRAEFDARAPQIRAKTIDDPVIVTGEIGKAFKLPPGLFEFCHAREFTDCAANDGARPLA